MSIDSRLVTLNDFNEWIKREYSKSAFVRLTGLSEVTVFVHGASQEKIDLLQTEVEYSVPWGVDVKFNTSWWSFQWNRLCRWWAGV